MAFFSLTHWFTLKWIKVHIFIIAITTTVIIIIS